MSRDISYESAWTVTILREDNTEFLRGKDHAPCSAYQHRDNVQVYDILAETDTNFTISIRRKAGDTDVYVTVLLDGVINDHFFIDRSTTVVTSSGWSKSPTVFHKYRFFHRSSKQINILSATRNDLLGHIAVRFYPFPPNIKHTLKLQADLPKPPKTRSTRPHMDFYAGLQISPTEMPNFGPAEVKLRLPQDILLQKLQIPSLHVLYRYTDEVREEWESPVRLAEEPPDKTKYPKGFVAMKRQRRQATDEDLSSSGPSYRRLRRRKIKIEESEEYSYGIRNLENDANSIIDSDSEIEFLGIKQRSKSREYGNKNRSQTFTTEKASSPEV
ncbi:hypothetical protein M422DRAFT_780169 [Sphaerobolus stellatus SS14]|uniref:Uncharacterized protein n=1 Tax=Sphaerobolus stellatus (strain SS14) TaxID=990650 RepID=A0A0C9VTV9_SPHS4|nr:hypothetical protein M422DRAFT_780169 [Sphaerobolus stellatus SS14]